MPVVWSPDICEKCRHKGTLTVLEPCWSCMSNENLSMAHITQGKSQITMVHFEPIAEE